jgi:energy-coupling factor transport system permease protein
MIRLDPRTKILLIFLTVILSATVPSGVFTCVWIAFSTLLGFLLGRIGKTLRAAIVFAALWMFAIFILPLLGGTLHTTLLVWLGLVFKCYPCCMMAGIVIGTTKISEFMAAMAKWNVPRSFVIPMAIMFRYFPTVKEDWGNIKNAMALRQITLSPACFIKNPAVVIDAIYLPLLVTASKTADELSASAIARGIENPGKRTSRLDIKIRGMDISILVMFGLLLIFGILFYMGGKP